MPSNDLARQKILAFIEAEIARTGDAPTIRDMMGYMGFKSPRAVTYHLERLVGRQILWEVDGKYLPYGTKIVCDCRLEKVL